MQQLFKKLRGLGPIGSTLADILTFLTTNWVLTVSTVIALWASLTSWAAAFVQNPEVQTFAEVFLALVWTIVGLFYLYDRTRPRPIRSVPDYRYGLTFEGLHPNIDPLNDDEWIAFGLQIRNFSQAPIRYTVEKFDVRIGSRALPDPQKVLTGYLARGGGKTVSPSKFKKDDVREFFGKRMKGTAKLALIYGHPEEKPVRRLRIEANITLHLPEEDKPTVLLWGADIVDETDEPFPTIS